MPLGFSIAGESDLLDIARCHKTVFPDALTSRMGLSYLTKIFSWYLSTDKAFLYLLKQDGMVIGYVGGILIDGTLAHGSASSLVQHTFNDAIKALLVRPWLFFHRDFMTRYQLFFRNVLNRLIKILRRTEIRTATKPSEPYAGIVVIGVKPGLQGKGFGAALLKEFDRIVLEKGFNRCVLTVKEDNHQAIKSYQKNGWVIAGKSKRSFSMEKRLI